MSEPKSFFNKLRVYFKNYWNILTTIAVIAFFAAFVMRVMPTETAKYRAYGL